MIRPFGGKVLLLFLLLVALAWPDSARAQREHLVYFQDTPYQLDVYKIYGRKDGPTIMIVGGIQGDEPGGFLSADLYIDLSLRRGNLLIVPRANFNSILQFKRGPNGDMNRKFGDTAKDDYDSRIVRILEELMAESDLLLNLHDGWGFYRPVYESKSANPMRYGQSIISDCEVFVSPETGRKLELGRTARRVIDRINEQIDNPAYHFHYMNTRTDENGSPYSEQRTSATFFALNQYGIPAFGVETSKNLPDIETKVLHHNLAINAFMDLFGLEPEQPSIYLEKPKLEYLVVAINNQIPAAVRDGQTLHLRPGDAIEVVHVEANYDRGLSVDILGLGTINDFRQSFSITKPTVIVAQKDHIRFGRVNVALTEAGAPAAPKPPPTFNVKSFLVEVEGRPQKTPDGGHLDLIDGDLFKLVDIETEGPLPSGDLDVNFKGFVADKVNNTGEDRGAVIHTARDLMARYSLSKTDKVYEVLVEHNRKVLARMTVNLRPPRLNHLVVELEDGVSRTLKDGQSLDVDAGRLVRVTGLDTNVTDNARIEFKFSGAAPQPGGEGTLTAFTMPAGRKVTLIATREGLVLGKIVFQSP